MDLKPKLIGFALGFSIFATPSSFAGDSVGEIIRDAVTLPLILPHVALEVLSHSHHHSTEVVVEHHYPHRPYYRRPAYWHRPRHHRHHYPYPDYSRPYEPPGDSKPPHGGGHHRRGHHGH